MFTNFFQHFQPFQWLIVAIAVGVIMIARVPTFAQSDPLPSWNDGAAKQAILEFVKTVTDKSSPQYVEPDDRVATFDQDGTLWVEHPLYTQAVFALERVKLLAPQNPQWKTQEPFKAILSEDQEAIALFTEGDWVQILAATHAGMTTFTENIVKYNHFMSTLSIY